MSSNGTRPSNSGSFSNTPILDKLRERSSTDINDPNNKISTNSSNGFDVQRVYETFFATLREPTNPKSPIGTQDYIDGYRELLKQVIHLNEYRIFVCFLFDRFFDQLGYVFKFVKDDVVDKLRILQSFVDKDKKDSPHFDTIQKAIDYETQHHLIKTNSENFARTLLRLHRALLFIVQFLDALNDRALSESTSTIAASCYDATLYHHRKY